MCWSGVSRDEPGIVGVCVLELEKKVKRDEHGCFESTSVVQWIYTLELCAQRKSSLGIAQIHCTARVTATPARASTTPTCRPCNVLRAPLASPPCISPKGGDCPLLLTA